MGGSHSDLRLQYLHDIIQEKLSVIRYTKHLSDNIDTLKKLVEKNHNICHLNIWRVTYYNPIWKFKNSTKNEITNKIHVTIGEEKSVAETLKLNAGIGFDQYVKVDLGIEQTIEQSLKNTNNYEKEITVTASGNESVILKQKFVCIMLFFKLSRGAKPTYDEEWHTSSTDEFKAKIKPYVDVYNGRISFELETGTHGELEEIDNFYDSTQLQRLIFQLKYKFKQDYFILDYHIQMDQYQYGFQPGTGPPPTTTPPPTAPPPTAPPTTAPPTTAAPTTTPPTPTTIPDQKEQHGSDNHNDSKPETETE